jgi:tRNA(Ile)-lysidine synthase
MIDWQHKNNAPAGPDLPTTILSLHVNHNLQSDAEKMAYAAGTAATRFKAVHSELRVPWGEPPFPPHPTQKAGDTADADADANADAGAGANEATTIESVARTARYQLLFDEMLQRRAYVLATGHHADDQVETVLMRLGSGSTLLGLGGMRPVRRFGMAIGKNDSDFGWFGHEGLERWIVRPLLDVPKVRQKSHAAALFFHFYGEFSCLTRVWCVWFFFSGQNSCDLRLA